MMQKKGTAQKMRKSYTPLRRFRGQGHADCDDLRPAVVIPSNSLPAASKVTAQREQKQGLYLHPASVDPPSPLLADPRASTPPRAAQSMYDKESSIRGTCASLGRGLWPRAGGDGWLRG